MSLKNDKLVHFKTAIFYIVTYFWIGVPFAQALETSNSKALLDQYSAAKIATPTNPFTNPFNEPIFLKSAEAADGLSGEIYALVKFPYEQVQAGVSDLDRWCDILILILNVKYCRATLPPENPGLKIALGRKYDQPLSAAYLAQFTFKVTSAKPDHIAIEMLAPTGPMNTVNYRIVVESAPVDNLHSVLHLTYSYGYDRMAKIAMQAYLATVGRGKVGFSRMPVQQDGSAPFIAGVLGVVERNTMRLYFALDAYLSMQGAPASDQQAARLNYWYNATERYARQLREVDRNVYISMKLREIERQRSSVAPALLPSK